MSVSASTLSRQAARTKNIAERQRLRAQAAKMRREARAKKKKPPSQREGYHPDSNAEQRVEFRAILGGAGNLAAPERVAIEGWRVTPQVELDDADEIELLRKTAFNRKRPEDFAIRLRANLVSARNEGRKEADANHREQINAISEAQRINVVSAFIAEMAAIEKSNHGLPPTILIAGYTIARVVDALRDAGYSENGRLGIGRRA